MIIIPIGDWFIARSEAFKILVEKFRHHKRTTQTSFSRVKTKHYNYDRKINELHARVREIESLLEALNEPKIKIKKKRKN
ncbi:MAG: hypothetical protein ABIB47_02750 [Candidatus Woesearchaeota archaeon]